MRSPGGAAAQLLQRGDEQRAGEDATDPEQGRRRGNAGPQGEKAGGELGHEEGGEEPIERGGAHRLDAGSLPGHEATDGPTPASPLGCPVSQRNRVLIATILGSAIVFLDSTIVNVALETIGRDLPGDVRRPPGGADVRQQRILRDPLGAAHPGGALNDYYGRARMFRIGPHRLRRRIGRLRPGAQPRALILARIVQGGVRRAARAEQPRS